jgi:hypothetical protein
MATLLIMPDCISTEVGCLYPNQILSLLLAPNLASLSKATFLKVLLLRGYLITKKRKYFRVCLKSFLIPDFGIFLELF